jgi:hypothetical protein
MWGRRETRETVNLTTPTQEVVAMLDTPSPTITQGPVAGLSW